LKVFFKNLINVITELILNKLAGEKLWNYAHAEAERNTKTAAEYI